MARYLGDNAFDRAVLGLNAQDEYEPCKIDSSIEDVLDAADDGHDVVVREGVYEEHLVLREISGLDLVAFEDEDPIIDGASFEPGTTLIELAPVDEGEVTDVHVRGFTFRNIPAPADGAPATGHAIARSGQHFVEDVRLVGNTFIGADAEDASGGAAIALDRVDDLRVEDNRISGAEPAAPQAAAITLDVGEARLEANTIEDTTRSVRITGADTVVMDGNEIVGDDTAYGVSLEDDARLVTSNNRLAAHDAGLQVLADAAVVASQGDTFADNAFGVVNAAESFVEIRESSFSGNDVGVLNVAEDAVVDARENWWNSPLGPDADDRDLPETAGDRIEGEVVYRHWCVDQDCTVKASVGADVEP